MTYALKGLPSDILNSDTIDSRRLKVESLGIDLQEFLRGNKYQVYGESGPLAVGGSRHIRLTTGDKDAVISLAHLSIEGGDTELVGYENSISTGGIAVPVRRFNLLYPDSHTMEAFIDPDVITTKGDEVSRFKSFGSASQGARPATFANIDSGEAFYLPRNSEFMWEIVNTDATDQTEGSFFKLIWFEGDFIIKGQ